MKKSLLLFIAVILLTSCGKFSEEIKTPVTEIKEESENVEKNNILEDRKDIIDFEIVKNETEKIIEKSGDNQSIDENSKTVEIIENISEKTTEDIEDITEQASKEIEDIFNIINDDAK